VFRKLGIVVVSLVQLFKVSIFTGRIYEDGVMKALESHKNSVENKHHPFFFISPNHIY
jgi:hypothetical protein